MIGIDPGLGGTGFAIADGYRFIHGETFNVSTTIKHLSLRADFIAKSVVYSALEHDNTNDRKALIEYPEFYTGRVGISCASTGGLIKLAYLVGYISSALVKVGYRVELITPNDWKGNIPKHISTNRIQSIIKYPVDSHLADAVGLILHHNNNGIVKNAKQHSGVKYSFKKDCFNTCKKYIT